MAGYSLEAVRDENGVAQCETMFREYGAWSVSRLESDFGFKLTDADVEAAHAGLTEELPKLLGTRGRLYIAMVGDDAAGVGGLKPIDALTGEIKRMYVRPGYRRMGIGRGILERLIDEGRELGFETLRLETAFFMTDAHRIYRALGFVDCDPFEAEGAEVGLAQYELFMTLAL